MTRLSRTAFLLACCTGSFTSAGLLVTGCGKSAGPAEHRALSPVRTTTVAPLPPLREPRLLAVPGEIRPVAGDWADSPDAAFRYSERHQQKDVVDRSPTSFAPTTSGAAAAPSTPVRPAVVQPKPGPIQQPAPVQAGPYTVEGIQRFKEPAAVAPPVTTFAAPSFNAPSIAPIQQASPTFQPPRQPQFVAQRSPVMGPPRDRSGLRPVSERINAINHQAIGLANRGALFAAREDLIQSLRIATQSLDAFEGTSAYSHALDQGLTALNEAEDFALHGAAATVPMRVEDIVAGHRTPVLRDLQGQEVSPVIAMQRYYGFAGERLTFAAGQLPAAADTLFWLGKVHNGLARQSQQADRLQGPQAMVCFRAALSAAPQHYLAANELGVLLAHYGQLHDAKALLQQSVTTRSHAEGWQNLAIVHKRLGETELAQLAEQEFAAAGGRTALASAGNSGAVKWVEPKTFAASGGQTPSAGGQAQSWEQPTGPVAAQPRSATGARR